MEDIYRRVADLGYMVLLTDAEGITVDYIGNPAWDDQLRKAGLYLGADWNAGQNDVDALPVHLYYGRSCVYN